MSRHLRLGAAAMFGVGLCVGLLVGLGLQLPSASGRESERLVSPGLYQVRQIRSLQAAGAIVVDQDNSSRAKTKNIASDLDNHPASRNMTKGFLNATKSKSSVKPGGLWPSWVEASLPAGFSSDKALKQWNDTLRRHYVLSAAPGCGRGQNQVLTLDDGSKACARYRRNLEQVQGELFSSILGRLLGLSNLLPVLAIPVKFQEPFWRRAAKALAGAGWIEGTVALITPWIEDLSPVMFPVKLKPNTSKFKYFQISKTSADVSETSYTDLAQWSDLVLFDYLTGNVDRAINNLFNLQWNPAALEGATHNLEKTPTGLFVFLDNESGLLHSYRLLDKYSPLHERLLSRVCVFRKPTVRRLRALAEGDPEAVLWTLHQQDPARALVPRLPHRHAQTLSARLERVLRHFTDCGIS